MPARPDTSDLEPRLRGHVHVLAGLVGERSFRKPSALAAAREYLARTLGDAGVGFTRQTYATLYHEGLNLLAELPGSDPALPALVVGAHYDTAHGTPGADDNASAVACLLELAARLAPLPRRRALICAFYDTEEPPCFGSPDMGSHHHAGMLRDRGREILGMLCLESLGYHPAPGDEAPQRPAVVRLLDRLLGGRQLYLVSDLASARFTAPFALRLLAAHRFAAPLILPTFFPRRFTAANGGDLSDHRSYWLHGQRAAMLTNTALFRNPHYHQPTDLPPTLDYPRLASLTHSLLRTVGRTCA